MIFDDLVAAIDAGLVQVEAPDWSRFVLGGIGQ
jgi:hypothetical protein